MGSNRGTDRASAKLKQSETLDENITDRLIAATRGAIGFGAGLLLADKFRQSKRKALGWSLFLSGLASTIPIAMHLFRNKSADATL